jgi:hypothetical protein
VNWWQPIETAPYKKGLVALLYVPGLNDWQRPRELPQILVGAWVETRGGGHWVSDYAEMEGGYESTGDYIVHPPIQPTHWMPLPSPP